MCDSKGVINTRRTNLSPEKSAFANNTQAGTLDEAIAGADAFIGFSKAGVLKPEMVKKMDAGDIFFSEKIDIKDDETLESLFSKMEDLAYKIVYEKVDLFFNKDLGKTPQDENQATFGYNITREDEKINFNLEDYRIYNKIRGLYPVPATFFIYNQKVIKIYKSIKTNIKSNKEPGTIVELNNQGIQISTKTNDIILNEIKIEGKSLVKNKEISNYSSFFKINDRIGE